MRFKTVLFLAIAAVLLTGGIAVGAVYATHPRDEKSYLLEVGRHFSGGAWNKTFRQQPTTFFVQQGDAACDWLGGQQLALWKSGDKFDMKGLTARYAATSTHADRILWGGSKQRTEEARRLIAQSAFEHLCGATFELRRSHNPFGSGGK